MTHIMLDIETFGTGPDAVITHIGAVKFDPNAKQDKFTAKEKFYKLITRK